MACMTRKPDIEDRRSRAAVVAEAFANQEIEGLHGDAWTREQFGRFVEGELSIDELQDMIRERFAP